MSIIGRDLGKKMIKRKGKSGSNEVEVERISWGVLSLLAFEGVSSFCGKIPASRGESVLECGLAASGRAGW